MWLEDCDTEGHHESHCESSGAWSVRRWDCEVEGGATPVNSQRAAPSPRDELSQVSACQTPARWEQIRVLMEAMVREVTVGQNPLGDEDSPPSSRQPAVSRPESTWGKTILKQQPHRREAKGGRRSPLSKYV